MKKSEAIKRIADYIEHNAGYLVPEQVLAICEGLGMEPPLTQTFTRTLPTGDVCDEPFLADARVWDYE